MRASVQLSALFDCSTCEIFRDCGGTDFGPCGCAFEHTGRAFQCGSCPGQCRAWHGKGDTPSEEWIRELTFGRTLKTVQANSIKPPPLPILIPTLTDRFASTLRLPVRWVGVQLESLLRVRKDGSGSVQGWVGGGSIAKTLRVCEGAEPLVLLHGDDPTLEALWGLPFGEVLQMLRSLSCRIVTGPTFSVFGDTREWPPAQSVMMMLRHHRFISELFATGFIVAPNLYWRSESDRRNWTDWLEKNPQVRVVYRDFSMTSKTSAQGRELRGLSDLIAGLGRPMHVLIQGIGLGNAKNTIRELAKVGATCSIISGQPPMLARMGERIASGGTSRVKDHTTSREDLGRANLQQLEGGLVSVARDLDVYVPRQIENIEAA